MILVVKVITLIPIVTRMAVMPRMKGRIIVMLRIAGGDERAKDGINRRLRRKVVSVVLVVQRKRAGKNLSVTKNRMMTRIKMEINFG